MNVRVKSLKQHREFTLTFTAKMVSLETNVRFEGKRLSAAGFVGLLIILFWTVYFIGLAYLHQNKLFLIFLLFILTCLLTENVWVRNDGVLFFGFFAGLLLFNSKQLTDE